MRLREVGEEHYIVSGDKDTAYGPLAPKRLPVPARVFWTKHGLGDSNTAVVVMDQRKVVAFLRFSIGAKWFVPGGTWVAPSHRRLGLTMRMWLYALDKHREDVKKVDVITVSRGGGGLMKRVQEARPGIVFQIKKRY